jgi:hypothetical protein
MTSPLGKYAEVVAAGTAVLVVAAFLISVLFGEVLKLDNTDANSLKEFALIAIGAVFGSAAGVNGWKREVSALHTRLDNGGVKAAAVSADKASHE